MSQIETVLFDCDDMLVDSGVICSRACAAVSREFSIRVDLREIFTRFKDVKLCEIIDIIGKEQGVTVVWVDAGHAYRAEVAHLFNTRLEDIVRADGSSAGISMPMCVVSNSPVSKMQHSLGKLNMLHYFPEKLFSGYDIQRWKPGPASMLRATKAIDVSAENYILVGDSSAGAQSGIDAGMEVFYFCAGPHNEPIVHLKVITFTHLPQLPELRKARGWNIMAQLSTLLSLTPFKLTREGK